MPRQVRNLGESDWAHIIQRGINREVLFYDEEDYERFYSTLMRYQRETDFELAACCLMSNHTHLLMQAKEIPHAEIIKKISVSYAAYYNKKYDRVGHVFQDRFRSEPVRDERYLLTVARYIYLNPQKAGICAAGSYPYTYLAKDGILSDCFSSPEKLREFLEADNDDSCLDYDTACRITDAEAGPLFAAVSGFQNPQSVSGLSREQRDIVLRKAKKAGLSVRQISRLTGINRNIIQRA